MRALIGIGANLGDRKTTIARACELLNSSEAITITACSSLHETLAIGGPTEQPKFLNAAAILETKLTPSKLLAQLQKIERTCGRTAGDVWSARPLDLDVLLYEDLILDRKKIKVPHRFLPFRRFVLDPACEIAGEWIHPILQSSLAELRTRLVKRPARFAFGGFPIETRERLMLRIRESFAVDRGISCETWHGQTLADQAIASGDPSLIREAMTWEPQLINENDEPRAIFMLQSQATLVDASNSPLSDLARFLHRRLRTDRIPFLMLNASDPESAFREVCGAVSAGFAHDS